MWLWHHVGTQQHPAALAWFQSGCTLCSILVCFLAWFWSETWAISSSLFGMKPSVLGCSALLNWRQVGVFFSGGFLMTFLDKTNEKGIVWCHSIFIGFERISATFIHSKGMVGKSTCEFGATEERRSDKRLSHAHTCTNSHWFQSKPGLEYFSSLTALLEVLAPQPPNNSFFFFCLFSCKRFWESWKRHICIYKTCSNRVSGHSECSEYWC